MYDIYDARTCATSLINLLAAVEHRLIEACYHQCRSSARF